MNRGRGRTLDLVTWLRIVISRGSRAVLTLGVVSSLAGLSCKSDNKKEREEVARRVTPDSTDDATQPIVDEDYKFQIEWPGEGWKLLREHEAKKILPDAVAVAVFGGGHFAAVIVEQATGATTTDMLDLVTHGLNGEQITVVSREPLTYLSKEAEQVVIEVTRGDIRFRHVIVGFVHQDYFFQLIAWGVANKTKVEDFAPFFDKFSLLPGTIEPRTTSSAQPQDLQGLGWVLEGGYFRSAVTNVAVRPREGWRVVVGSELEEMSDEADVGLVRSDPEAYIMLLTEPVSPGASDAFLQDRRRELAETVDTMPEETPIAATFAGADLQLWRHDTGMVHLLHGVQIREGVGIQVLAWHLAGLRERALPQIHEGLASFDFLTPAQGASLRAQLSAAPDPQNSVGIGWAIRGGIYRDFNHRLQWTAPEGFWRMRGGEGARDVVDGGVLSVEGLDHGIHAAIVVGDASEGGLEDWRTHVESSWSIEVLERTTVEEDDGRPMGRTRGRATLGGTPYDFVLGYGVRDGVGIAMTAWGPSSLTKADPDAIARVLEPLQILDDLPETTSDGRFEDHRLGFALTPPAGFILHDETPEQLAPVGRLVFWKKGKSQIGVTALCVLGEGQDEDWFQSFIEQTVLQEFVGSVRSGSTTRGETELAGRPGRQFTWKSLRERVESVFISERRTVYSVTLINIDPELAAELRRSFEVLD